MTRNEQLVTLTLNAGNILPGILAIIALAKRNRVTTTALVRALAAFNITHFTSEKLFLKRHTPPRSRALPTLIAIISPFQVLGALFSSDEIEWRGRRLRIERGGDFIEIRPKGPLWRA
jgi:hypothetical protein